MRVALNSLRYSGGCTGGSCAASGDAFAGAALSGAEIVIGRTAVVGTTTGSALSMRQSRVTVEAPLYLKVAFRTAPPLSVTGSYVNCVRGTGGEAGGEAGDVATGCVGKPAVAGVPSSIVNEKSDGETPSASTSTTKR